MKLWLVFLIGGIFGALDGVGIFYAPEEPYKMQIFCAATLKGVLVGLLTAFSLNPESRWWQGLAFGLLYGLAFGTVIYLAKGGPVSGDAPFVIPASAVSGALTGLFLTFWAF